MFSKHNCNQFGADLIRSLMNSLAIPLALTEELSINKLLSNCLPFEGICPY